MMHEFMQREPGVLICKICDDFPEARIHQPSRKRGAVEAIELAQIVEQAIDGAAAQLPKPLRASTEIQRMVVQAIQALARDYLGQGRENQ